MHTSKEEIYGLFNFTLTAIQLNFHGIHFSKILHWLINGKDKSEI